MKKITAFLAIALVFAAGSITAQKQFLKTDKGKLVPYGQIKLYTTVTNDTLLVDSITVTDNKAGIIEATVVASDSVGNGVTGKQIFRYKKSNGTITLSSATNDLAIVTDSGVSGATFIFSATSYGNLALYVKGKSSATMKWRTRLLQTEY